MLLWNINMKIDAIYMKKIYFSWDDQKLLSELKESKKENTGTNDTYE